MPDHIHLVAHQGHEAVRLGQWVKALKAVVGGLERREQRSTEKPGPLELVADELGGSAVVGRVPQRGGEGTPQTHAPAGSGGPGLQEHTRIRSN